MIVIKELRNAVFYVFWIKNSFNLLKKNKKLKNEGSLMLKMALFENTFYIYPAKWISTGWNILLKETFGFSTNWQIMAYEILRKQQNFLML